MNESGRFLLTSKPDGIIDEADTRLVGSSDPGFILGLTNSIKYKGIDFNFNFYGMFDRIMQNSTRMDYGLTSDGIEVYYLQSTLLQWLFVDIQLISHIVDLC
ncbi:hypothetical protein EZS27_029899 [termite gut metagenome]|uniref:TonB-dependent receptor SusC n=1 Tax=termite gut metagenome TaxID=433724 RepID=A0A5J4QFG5_9ZZZZ